MKPTEMVLKCYAEKDGDSWFAICLDLNIYARADTYKEVRSRLAKKIVLYLREAVTIDQDHVKDLLHRPAPLWFWARYYWMSILRWVHREDGGEPRDKGRPFDEALPMHPA